MNAPRLKMSVICASRGNPSGLRTIIGALDMLATKEHDIAYVVACDADDRTTQDVITRLCAEKIPVLVSCNHRHVALGTAWNDAAADCAADLYALVTDRSICVTPAWDAIIADAYGKDNRRVTWWTTNAGPVIPIVTEKWRQAAGGIFTDYFPFWFDDTWLHELSALVHGLPNFMVQAGCFVGKKSPVTKRMRDLRFWMDFFIATRPERREHARKIRDAFGLKAPDMTPIDEWFASNDAKWEKDWQMWERVMGDPSEPDETYLEAKKNAEAMMKDVAVN